MDLGHLPDEARLEHLPEEVREEPSVQLAYCELLKSQAKCRRLEALYLEARMRGTTCRVAANPEEGAAICECFRMDSDAEPSVLRGASDGDESGSLIDDFARW